MGFAANFIRFPVENRFRFDKVTASLKVWELFRDTVFSNSGLDK